MLYIVGRLELAIHHVVIFHVHEGGIMIGFGIAVAGSTLMKSGFIFFQLFQGIFKIFDILLQLLFSVTTS